MVNNNYRPFWGEIYTVFLATSDLVVNLNCIYFFSSSGCEADVWLVAQIKETEVAKCNHSTPYGG